MVKDASQEAHPAALDGPEEARREVPDQTHRRALLEEAHGHAALHLEAVRGHGVHLVAAALLSVGAGRLPEGEKNQKKIVMT